MPSKLFNFFTKNKKFSALNKLNLEINDNSQKNPNQAGVNDYQEKSLSSLSNTNPSLESLVALATSDDQYVRGFIARNPNVPIEILEQLVLDESEHVRSSVARNHKTSAEILRELAEDESFIGKDSVARNPNTPKDLLIKLAASEDKFVRGSVARNPTAPSELLYELASDEESYVKWNVTRNPSAPIDLLRKLSNSEEVDSDHNNFTHSSIPIDLKAAILVAFTNWSINNPRYQDFFRYNDLGIPVALALTADLVIPKPSGIKILSETYILMCAELGIDENKTFENFDEILDEVMYSHY